MNNDDYNQFDLLHVTVDQFDKDDEDAGQDFGETETDEETDMDNEETGPKEDNNDNENRPAVTPPAGTILKLEKNMKPNRHLIINHRGRKSNKDKHLQKEPDNKDVNKNSKQSKDSKKTLNKVNTSTTEKSKKKSERNSIKERNDDNVGTLQDKEQNVLDMKFRKMMGISILDEEVEKITNNAIEERVETLEEYFNKILMHQAAQTSSPKPHILGFGEPNEKQDAGEDSARPVDAAEEDDDVASRQCREQILCATSLASVFKSFGSHVFIEALTSSSRGGDVASTGPDCPHHKNLSRLPSPLPPSEKASPTTATSPRGEKPSSRPIFTKPQGPRSEGVLATYPSKPWIGIPKGKRGCPRQTWRRTVLAEATSIGMTWSEVKREAQDRSRWRTSVDALCPI
ncbi:unnamed protein product [Spodoptera exigua]|nr:unnamed protein product [Spodoptera exigua]